MEKKTGRLTPENFWEKEERRTEEKEEGQELFPQESPEQEETVENKEQEEPMRDPYDPMYIKEPEEITSEESEEEESEDEIKKLIRLLAIVGSAVLLVVLIGVIIAFAVMTQKVPAGEESRTEEESVSYQSGEMLGVVFSCTDGMAEVYNAELNEVKQFDLNQAKKMTDQYGQPMGIDMVLRGQLVQVQYNSASNQVEMFRLTSHAQEITDITDLRLQDNKVVIQEETYQFNDQLICMYRGKDYPVEKITPQMIVKASVMEGQLYTLQILYGSGTVKIQNIPEEYVGMELILTPEKGNPVSQVLKKETQEIAVTEGLVSYRVQNGNLVEDQGQIMVSGSGEAQSLVLKASEKKQGRILFDINVEGAVITIGDKVYEASKELILPYGEYEAVIKADGFDVVETKLNVNQPYRVVQVDMNAATTQVVVSSSLSGSRLFLNGVYKTTLRGKAEVLELEAGTYSFTAENEGYEPMTIKLTIKANMADQIVYFTGFIPIQEPPEESQEPVE